MSSSAPPSTQGTQSCGLHTLLPERNSRETSCKSSRAQPTARNNYWEITGKPFLKSFLRGKKIQGYSTVSYFTNYWEPAGCSGTGSWPCTQPEMTQNSFVSVYLHKNFPQNSAVPRHTSLPNPPARLTLPISPPPKSFVMFAKCPLLANSNSGFQVRPCR